MAVWRRVPASPERRGRWVCYRFIDVPSTRQICIVLRDSAGHHVPVLVAGSLMGCAEFHPWSAVRAVADGYLALAGVR